MRKQWKDLSRAEKVAGTVVWLIVIFVVGLLVAWLMDKSALQERRSQIQDGSMRAIQITAGELYRIYDGNEILADKLYRDSLLTVAGYVASVDKDFLDNPWVMLTDGRSEYALEGVQCSFSDEHIDELAMLQKGELVSIRGICHGLTLTTVMLAECELRLR